MLRTINSSENGVQVAMRQLVSNNSGQIKIGHSYSGTGEKSLNVNEHLYIEGDKQNHVYFLLEGVVGTYKMMADGRRQIVGFVYPGDMLGFDHAETFSSSAEALSTCRVRCIPSSAIEKLMLNEPGFGQTVLRITSRELADTRDLLVSLGKKSAMEKLSTFLLRISQRTETHGQLSNTINLPMKRGEIGDYLGLTIETVSRNFTKLKRSKVIELVSNSEVRINDIDALMELAEGKR
ncbi:MAG: helix-turn-helix domain-containing protein [Granulosicoccaceae bacterium]